jgi:hypothetical protein
MHWVHASRVGCRLRMHFQRFHTMIDDRDAAYSGVYHLHCRIHQMKLEHKRKRGSAEERAAEADKKRRLDKEAAAKTYLEPWQRPRLVHLNQGRGTTGLPPVAWKHIISYVSAIAPKQLRGAREVAIDLASASVTCSAMRAAVLREWPALTQFCIDQQLPLAHANLPQHVRWERLLAAPLRHKVSELQSALRAVRLSTEGTPAVLAQRLLKHFKLSGPVAVPPVLIWAVESEHAQFKRAPARLRVARDLASYDRVAAEALQQWKQAGYRAELLQGSYDELLARKREHEREKRERAERDARARWFASKRSGRRFYNSYNSYNSYNKYNRYNKYW